MRLSASIGVCVALALGGSQSAAVYASPIGVDDPTQIAQPERADARDMGKTGDNKKKKKKKKKKNKGPNTSVSVNSNGAKVRAGGQYGSVAVGPKGPSASFRPGGGPMRIGIGANGKPRFGFKFGGGR